MLTPREHKAIRELQRELEVREFNKIYIRTYNFFGRIFIGAIVETGNSKMIIDCSIDYLERYGIAHTVSTFERIYGLL